MPRAETLDCPKRPVLGQSAARLCEGVAETVAFTKCRGEHLLELEKGERVVE
jgi:hypothetical protein